MFEPLALLFLDRVPLKPGDRVLDVACGTGIVARLVAPVVAPVGGQGGRITGVDISGEMLVVARSSTTASGAAIQWRLGDAANLPIEDDAFDVVLCQQGFQYFADQAAALSEMYRVLSTGGRLALCFARAVNADSQPYQWEKARALHLHAGYEAGRKAQHLAPFFHGDANMISKLITQAGFLNSEVENLTIKVQMGSLDRLIHEDQFPDLVNDVQMAVVRHVQNAMKPYTNGRGVEIPYGMHIATAQKL